LTYTEKVLVLESKVVELAPKAKALDRIATHSEGSFCIRDAAKTLQVKEKVLKQTLVERSWIYRRPMGSGYLAYSDKLRRGLMEHKIIRGERPDGSEWVETQARITAKGMALLSEIFSSELAVN
jgi:phage antirepressor YoqD-like protein